MIIPKFAHPKKSIMSSTNSNSELMQNYDRQLGDWIESEKSAIELIHIIGNLWFNKSIELVIFRN